MPGEVRPVSEVQVPQRFQVDGSAASFLVGVEKSGDLRGSLYRVGPFGEPEEHHVVVVVISHFVLADRGVGKESVDGYEDVVLEAGIGGVVPNDGTDLVVVGVDADGLPDGGAVAEVFLRL